MAKHRAQEEQSEDVHRGLSERSMFVRPNDPTVTCTDHLKALGSWADEMDTQPLPGMSRAGIFQIAVVNMIQLVRQTKWPFSAALD